MKIRDRVRMVFRRLLLLPLVGLSVGVPFLVVLVGFATHREAALRFLIPAILPLCAVAIWSRNRSVYIAFVLGVWLFIPLLRRLVDYSAGQLDPNPMLLAPYLTTLAVPLLRIRSLLRAPVATILPFILCAIGIFLGFSIGLFSYPVASVIHDFLNWITPVAFAAFLAVDSPVEFQSSLRTWFPLFVVCCAVYTLFQFVFVFPWDIAWLINMDAPSMGSTDPFSMRAFGPLNSAGTAAFVLSAGGLVILNLRSWWRIPAFVITTLALLTTQVRAGWLVLALGILMSLYKSPKVAVPAICVLGAMGITLSVLGLQSSGQNISDRFASFSHPDDDDSANGRIEGYSVAFADLEAHPLGHGLGVPDDLYDVQGSFSLLDAAPVHILATFGWIGGAAYCAGFLLLMVPVVGGISKSKDNAFLITAIPAFSLASIFFLGSVTVALSGFLIWSLLASSLFSLAHDATADRSFRFGQPEAWKGVHEGIGNYL